MNHTEDYSRFFNTVTRRYSCRNYSPEPVSRELITALLETARLAPSACNRQPWMFVVADSRPLREEVAGCYNRDWAKEVPAFIIACGDHSKAWHRPEDGKDHTDVDISIAIEHICLAATTLGLATCWICNFDPEKLRATLRLPENIEAIAIIALGYPRPGVAIPEKTRKPLEEIVRWEKF